jgi:hypothetical protein
MAKPLFYIGLTSRKLLTKIDFAPLVFAVLAY